MGSESNTKWVSLERFKKYAGHWQNLQPFFNMPMIKIFVSWFAIAPVFIKLLERFPDHIKIEYLKIEYVIVMEMPFSWVLLWVSSFLFFLAFVIYYFCCPELIKKYRSFSDFEREGNSPRWLVYLLRHAWLESKDRDKFFRPLFDKKFATLCSHPVSDYHKPVVESRGTVWRFEYQGSVYEVCVPSEFSDLNVRELFWEIFGEYSGARNLTRNIVWCLIFSSLIMVFIVIIQSVLFVFPYIWGYIFSLFPTFC